ncbi:hypothetical protein [Hoyosella altamirensis]|uniref:Uncharacterized protein n=1 Tax=Hoyosella altamirensis TaxID=616997 RepID=A0A839RLM3_9ACTN|nr:hypothetical protein [Hoyosella altamirensis]MBB3037400.1 hypothetical protein [Hoyosella altamirensis]
MSGLLLRAALVLLSGWAAVLALLLGITANGNEALLAAPSVTAVAAALAFVITPLGLHRRSGGVASLITIHCLIVMILSVELPTVSVLVAAGAALLHVTSVWVVREPELGPSVLGGIIPWALVITLVTGTALGAPWDLPWFTLAAPILAILVFALAITGVVRPRISERPSQRVSPAARARRG